MVCFDFCYWDPGQYLSRYSCSLQEQCLSTSTDRLGPSVSARSSILQYVLLLYQGDFSLSIASIMGERICSIRVGRLPWLIINDNDCSETVEIAPPKTWDGIRGRGQLCRERRSVKISYFGACACFHMCTFRDARVPLAHVNALVEASFNVASANTYKKYNLCPLGRKSYKMFAETSTVEESSHCQRLRQSLSR